MTEVLAQALDATLALLAVLIGAVPTPTPDVARWHGAHSVALPTPAVSSTRRSGGSMAGVDRPA